MRSLLRVELTRLRWRRAVVLLLVAAVVVPAIIAAARIWSTRSVSDSELEEVRNRAGNDIAMCEANPRDWGLDSADACEQEVVRWQLERAPLVLEEERGGSGVAVVSLLALLLLLAGTTFAGHDWNTRSMSNQLLFEPRRHRVWAAKALAVTGVALAVALAVSTAYWLVLYGVVRSRDLALPTEVLGDNLAYGARGAALAAAAALAGFALTTLLRSTVATLGLLFFVTVTAAVLISALGVSERWQPQVNAQAIVANGATWEDWDYDGYCGGGDSYGCVRSGRLGPEDGLLYYGLPLLAVGAASLVSFRRRDVP